MQESEELRRLASATRALAFAGRALERAVGDMTLAQFRVLSLIASSPERAGELARRAAANGSSAAWPHPTATSCSTA